VKLLDALDDADRVQQIRHFAGQNDLLVIDYTWTINNWVETRTETDYTVQPSTTAVVSFDYDDRGRLTDETRVVDGTTTVYDLSYTYDQLGNRETKFDAVTQLETRYTYDVELEQGEMQYPTRNNRLLYYELYDMSQTPEKLLRTVMYWGCGTAGRRRTQATPVPHLTQRPTRWPTPGSSATSGRSAEQWAAFGRLWQSPKGRLSNEGDVTGPSLTVQDADDCVEDVARAYENMSYLQLRDLSNTPEGRWLVVDRMWRGVPIRLTIQVSHFGRLRHRVSVEIAASAEGDKSWPWTPCVYMERYASGRLYKGSTKGARASVVRRQRVLIQLLVYGLAAAGMLYVAYHCARAR